MDKTQEEIIKIIETSPSAREVMDTWYYIASDRHRLVAFAPLIETAMVAIATGKDPRFTAKEIEETMISLNKERQAKKNSNP